MIDVVRRVDDHRLLDAKLRRIRDEVQRFVLRRRLLRRQLQHVVALATVARLGIELRVELALEIAFAVEKRHGDRHQVFL